MEENPALEQGNEEGEDLHNEEIKDEFDSSEEEDFELDGSEDEYDNLDLSEYVSDSDDDIADYRMRDDNYPDAEEKNQILFVLKQVL